jgi:hypothetical protein
LAGGDELRIAGSVFIVQQEVPAATVTPAASALTPPATVSDARPAAEAKRAKSLRLALVALMAVLVVLVVVVVLMPAQPPPKPADGKAPVGALDPATQPLRLYYERVLAGPDQAFRYVLNLERGRLQVTVDDAANHSRIDEQVTLNEEQLATLRAALLTPAVLQLTAPPPQRHDQRLDRARLLIQAGPTGNYLDFRNVPYPTAFADLMRQLSQFIQAELAIYADPIPREELLTLAREQYDFALRYDQERTVEPTNLYKAILAYRQALERLRFLDNKPDFYREAQDRLAIAEKDLDQQLAKLEREAITFRRLDQLEKARACLREIVDRVPDRNNKYVRAARSELISIEDQLTRRPKHK